MDKKPDQKPNQSSTPTESSGKQKTAEHYSKQWGSTLGFSDFIARNPKAAQVMPGRILPWSDLFTQIRKAAELSDVTVYDAACGFGDVLNQLFCEPIPMRLHYTGTDIHDNIDQITVPKNTDIFQWDITKPLPNKRQFDYIICRAALHHTPDPQKTFIVLANQVKDGGTLAVSVYTKKGMMREAVDDVLREKITTMENNEAFLLCREFSQLGKALRQVKETVNIENDLEFLGIKAGKYTIQELIYDYFMKCWYNENYNIKHCDIVNFDWYHPPYAYRYTINEFEQMFKSNGFRITKQATIKPQHYIEGVKYTK